MAAFQFFLRNRLPHRLGREFSAVSTHSLPSIKSLSDMDLEDGQEDSDGDDESDEWCVLAKPDEFEPDTFSLTISQLVRDRYHLDHYLKQSDPDARKKSQTHENHFVTRLIATVGLLLLTLTLQIYLLSQVKRFVSAKAVHDMRIIYDEYELHMYGNNPSRMDITPNGKHRGRPEYFNASAFDSLPEDLKAEACRIPLSQPCFFFSVLLVWTVTIMGEYKLVISRITRLIINTARISSMANCRDPMKDPMFQAWNPDPAHNRLYATGSEKTADEEAAESQHHPHLANEEFVIRGLTTSMRVFFVTVVFLPRILITTFLLWLGCRWLLATDDFADLILNAVALEFILCLKEIIYSCLAPARNSQELQYTKMLPTKRIEKADHSQLTEVVVWTSLSCIWVVLYMTHLQMVIPDYRWDVHAVCVDWIAVRYAV